MPDEETTLEWFDAEGLRDPLALRDFFAGEHFDPQAVVYLRAARAVLALEAEPEGSQPHLQPETLRDACRAARSILRDIGALIPRAFDAARHDDPLQLTRVGTIDGQERDRLANALIRAVAFATGDEALREFIALLEGEVARFHSAAAQER